MDGLKVTFGTVEQHLGIVVVEEEVVHSHEDVHLPLQAAEVIDVVRLGSHLVVEGIDVHPDPLWLGVAERPVNACLPDIIPLCLPVYLP